MSLITQKIHYFDPNHWYPKSNLQTVLVGGCFDILHYGHLTLLKGSKKLADRLIIALEPDQKIIQTKKREPIHSAQQRAEILSHLTIVDAVFVLPILQNYEDYLNVVKKLQPDLIAITNDDPQMMNKQKQAEAIGAQLVVVNHKIEALSSSKIILDALA